MAIERLNETALPEVPTRPSKQQGKAHVVELKLQHGSVSATGSAFKDLEFEYALACSLQTPGDQ